MYDGEQFEAISGILAKGVDGSLTTSFDFLPWRSDALSLDPFKTTFQSEVERYVPETTEQTIRNMRERGEVNFPTAATRGEAVADRIAFGKGVDITTPKPGSGRLLDVAKTMLGVPYVFGAQAPGKAFDCSGFTSWVYKRTFGVNLPHFSQGQAAMTDSLKRDELQPGDLVFFSYGRLGSGEIDDVKIYVGDGKMIGASASQDLPAATSRRRSTPASRKSPSSLWRTTSRSLRWHSATGRRRSPR
jgi:cell wall-associated NlpC family hydrolase